VGRDVIAIVSDLHCGSTLGLCPAEGIDLDDGGSYSPSDPQKKLWECWLDYCDQVARRLRPDDSFRVVVVGDLVDGDHHGTSQIVSKNLVVSQQAIALACLKPLLGLHPKSVVIIRGTEAHVGGSAAYEESIGRTIGSVRCSDTGAYSHWHYQVESNGVLLDFAHHGTVGTMPWTRPNAANSLAARIGLAAFNAGRRAPDLVFRAHRHQEADSGDNQKVRVIALRAWQLSTAFTHKVAAGSLPEIGGLILTTEGGNYDLDKIRYQWRRPEPARWIA
jgi:hypothetical protein